jgi:LPS-assembly lipoprotein
MQRRILAWLLCALLLALAGCGFGLRQPVNFAFSSLYSGVAPTSPLGVELKRQLQSSGQLEYITEASRLQEAQAVLDILTEQRIKTVVGVSATGQVREFQLRLIIKFRLRTPQGKELIPETELVQQRALSYDEVFALAKEAEEAMLYRNMQSDMVQQILRRLAAVKSLE